jgi:hypothetical protein
MKWWADVEAGGAVGVGVDAGKVAAESDVYF